MVELVAERGYEAVTVRELVRRSGVSSRAFYRHFANKQECFLRTHEVIVLRMARRIVAAQAGERNSHDRLRLTLGAFASEVERNPEAACLALIETYAAGPEALKQARRAEHTLEAMIVESLTDPISTAAVSPPLADGAAAGAMWAIRSRLLDGQVDQLPPLIEGLVDWSRAYRAKSISALPDLDRRAGAMSFTTEPLPLLPESVKRKPTKDRALILAAVAKLCVSDNYSSLTQKSLCLTAGISGRSFNALFDSVEGCFVAAIMQRAEGALAEASYAAQLRSRSWAGGVYQATHSLCVQIATDPVLANLCFVQVLAPGAVGMKCQQRLVAKVAKHLRGGASLARDADQALVEASVGAAWGVLRKHIATDRAFQAPRIAGSLAYLLLAPAIGPAEAVEAIRSEVAAKSRIENIRMKNLIPITPATMLAKGRAR